MTVTPIEPDSAGPPVRSSQADDFSSALASVGAALRRADAAENAFAIGSGGLQEAVVARATADVMLQIATASASRATQALTAILNMQI